MGTRRSLPTLVGLLVVLASLPFATPVAAASPNVVISQIYGGGGNANAQFQSDFIELFNRGGSAVSLSGWSVQYAATTGVNWLRTDLTGVNLGAGQYYLIQQASGTGCSGLPCGAPLPAADATGTTAMASGAGKVALVNNNTTITTGTVCPLTGFGVVDFVGYGNSTDCFEGTGPAPTLSNTLAALRANRCADIDDNTPEFSATGPNPRNTATDLAPCPADPTPSLSINDVSMDEGNSGTTTFTFNVSLSRPAPAGGVTFNIATADGTATTGDNDYTAKALTGQTIPATQSSYTFGVQVSGDTTEESDETFFVNVTGVTGANVGDGVGQGTIENDDTDVCVQDFTHTYEIQGDQTTPAITGPVTTQGVIVGDFEGPTSAGLQGFFIQDVEGDDDATTSDGLFVFRGNTDSGLDVGDVVRVTGNVSDFNAQTQVAATAVGSLVECGPADLPAAVDITLPQGTATELERYEGMRARFPQSLVISEYFEFEQFGEIVLALPASGENRLFTPTHLEEPGSAAAADRLSLNQRSQIRLNDGLANSNPTSVRHPNGDPFSLTNRFRGGDTVANAFGILGERTSAANPFPRYRIEPTRPADYTAVNTRQPAPGPVGGSIQVAAMNTLNYFLTPDFPTGNPNDNKCGPLQNVECRGHDFDQPQELNRQRAKLVSALTGLGAEVIGLNELENTPGVNPVGDLVAGLNAAEGAGTYSYIDTGVIGTDAIRVGLVYKPGAVTPLGAFEILNSTDDPRFIDTLNRPVLAQTFRVNATGAVFTVAVNHLKSKNASPACLPDSGDGQGSCSEVREAAAQALVDWLATDPTGSDDPDFLIVGDLNSYAMEDPIDAVRAGSDDVLGTGDDFTNLIAQYMGEHAYSFVFDAMAGYLDHALASSSLTAQVTGATEWHINADEPDILDYDTTFKPDSVDALFETNAFRSSDHDPVIVGMNLTPDIGSVTGSGSWAEGSFDLAVLFNPSSEAPKGTATLVVADGTLVASSYDWLTITGKTGTFQGTGSFNGVAGHGFLVSVRDGGTPGTRDRIRVRIWDASGNTVYDSQPSDPITATPTSPLTSGNLTVHKLT